MITELFATAYAAHLRRSVAARRGRRTKVNERELRLLLEQIIPDIMLEHQGVDGDLVWHLAFKQLEHRRGAIEERILIEEPSAREVIEDAANWRTFRARLTASPAGLAWGHLEARLPRRWS